MSILVLRSAPGASLQDNGRKGFAHWGIPPSGPMDQMAYQKGQAILCNAHSTAAIEMGFPAPLFLFEKPCFMVITGADLGAELVNHPQAPDKVLSLPVDRPAHVPAGTYLRFTQKKQGNCAYLSVQGGFALDEWLGSCSTNVLAGAGGWEGRYLQKNDRLPFQQNPLAQGQSASPEQPRLLSWWAAPLRPSPSGVFSFGPGPDDVMADHNIQDWLAQARFQTTPESNRMGFRLAGPPLPPLPALPRWSAAVVRGSIQCLPNGQLIVLMADHQTTGGYPLLGVLTPESTDALAQWPVGKTFVLEQTSTAAAEESFVRACTQLHQLKIACTFPFHDNHRL